MSPTPNSSGATRGLPRRALPLHGSSRQGRADRRRDRVRQAARRYRLAPADPHGGRAIGELTPALKRSPVPVVIDHMGRIDASRGLEQRAVPQSAQADGRPEILGQSERRRPRHAPGPALRRRGAVRAQAGRGIRRPLRLGHRLSASQSQARSPTTACWSTADARSRPSAAALQALLVDNPQRFYRFGRPASSDGEQDHERTFARPIAIVTGAGCVGPGWGNGRATCVRFAEEGAKIFAVERDLDSAAETVERVKAVGGEIVAAPMRRHRQRFGRRHGGGLREAFRAHRHSGQ